MGDLALDNLLGTPLMFGCPSALFVSGQCITDGCQWVTQFMGEERQEFILAPIRLAKCRFSAFAYRDLFA